ncbi:MAG: hypothetical protein JO285_13170 [Kutzneria sp.]|nr:hypothetical protein [Kutzneria sp.]
MSNAGRASQPKPTSEFESVFDFLDQVRLRSGMWVTGGSLHELSAMLVGYLIALDVHEIDEPFDFWPSGPFTEWLYRRQERDNSLSWAAQIEREASTAGQEPLAMFFDLLDEYQAAKAEAAQD